MKKYLKLLIFMMVLMVPATVFADGDSDEFEGYLAVVNNKAGADCYNDDGKKIAFYKYGDPIWIDWEFTSRKVLYSYGYQYDSRMEDEDYDEEEDDSILRCNFKSEDLKPVSNSAIVGELDEDEEPQKKYVIEKGLVLRSGPGNTYSILIDDIPVGEEIEYYYTTENEWEYVKYNGKFGYANLYFYDADTEESFDYVASIRENEYIINGTNNPKLYSSMNKNKLDIPVQIELGEKVRVYVQTSKGTTDWFLLEKEGKLFWYEATANNFFYIDSKSKNDVLFINPDKFEVYDDVELKNKSSLVLKKDTVYTVEAYSIDKLSTAKVEIEYVDKFIMTKDGKTYYVKTTTPNIHNNPEEELNKFQSYALTLKDYYHYYEIIEDTVKVYNGPYGDAKAISTLKKGDLVAVYTEYLYEYDSDSEEKHNRVYVVGLGWIENPFVFLDDYEDYDEGDLKDYDTLYNYYYKYALTKEQYSKLDEDDDDYYEYFESNYKLAKPSDPTKAIGYISDKIIVADTNWFIGPNYMWTINGGNSSSSTTTTTTAKPTYGTTKAKVTTTYRIVDRELTKQKLSDQQLGLLMIVSTFVVTVTTVVTIMLIVKKNKASETTTDNSEPFTPLEPVTPIETVEKVENNLQAEEITNDVPVEQTNTIVEESTVETVTIEQPVTTEIAEQTPNQEEITTTEEPTPIDTAEEKVEE